MMSRAEVGYVVVCVYSTVVCWVGVMCAVRWVITISLDGLLLLWWWEWLYLLLYCVRLGCIWVYGGYACGCNVSMVIYWGCGVLAGVACVICDLY
jgi:hypothetical protein